MTAEPIDLLIGADGLKLADFDALEDAHRAIAVALLECRMSSEAASARVRVLEALATAMKRTDREMTE